MQAASTVRRDMAVVGDGADAATLLEPTRLKLVGALREPDSATGLARRFGLPRQRVNYHLRELERAGLVELVTERKRGNCTERLVRATARSYLISPEVLGPLGADPDKIEDRLSSAYLVAVAARTIREVGELRGRAERAGKRLPTITVQADVRFATAADRNAFAEDLANAVAELVREYHDESASGGRVYRFYAGGYPAITKEEGHQGTEAPRHQGGDEKPGGES